MLYRVKVHKNTQREVSTMHITSDC